MAGGFIGTRVTRGDLEPPPRWYNTTSRAVKLAYELDDIITIVKATEIARLDCYLGILNVETDNAVGVEFIQAA